MRRGARITIALCAALSALVAGASGADPVTDAVALVRGVWYEGIPLDAARRLDDAAVAKLGTMLSDPLERPHHGNIVMALGMSGHRAAFRVLADHARSPLDGEVDRATFRARTRIAHAMGHLARSDRRALRWLMDRAEEPPPVPTWRFRHHAGESLGLLLDESVLTGLALSGADEAAALLVEAEETADGAHPQDRRRRHLATHARDVHRRIVREGPGSAVQGQPR